VKQIRKRLTYANVMSSIAVFLVLGGGAAIAAKTVLPKKSVGTPQLKANAVTTAKIKKNAVTTKKIKDNAVTGAKIADGSITGAEVNASTLGTVPNSATTDEVRASKGILLVGQQATVFEYGPVRLTVSCEPYEAATITARVYIESSAEGTTFLSWEDSGRAIGPGTAATDREVTSPDWGSSNGPMGGEAGAPVNVTTAAGSSFSGVVGVGSEKDTNTCWYWFHGTIIS
jgi:hypothetical protein